MITPQNDDQYNNYLLNDLCNTLEKCKSIGMELNEDWATLFILLRMIQIQECEDEKLWQDFTQEILHNNRFFPQSPILDKIKELATFAITELNPGDILYRSREYTVADIFSNPFIKKCMEYVKTELPDLHIKDADFNNSSAIDMIMSTLAMKPGIEEQIKEKYKSATKSHDSFWGFDEAGSDAPPEDKTKSMRANPEGIRYLYAARDVDTALAEMRPQYGQTYSVATIEITDPVKLFDLTNDPKENVNTEGKQIFSRKVLDKMFSDPNYGNALDYIPTQFLCEFIKHQGFDGIIYNSALYKGGKNIVLFAVDGQKKKYKITGTEVYVINNINIDHSKILPVTDSDLDRWLGIATNDNMTSD